MNKDQFVFWIKGFAKAVNNQGPTPKQWETIISELNTIKDCPNFGSEIGTLPYGYDGSWVTSNTAYTSNQLELELD